MKYELIFSAFALFLSVTALVWTIISNLEKNKNFAIASCFSLMAQAESMLKDVPSALKFHTISTEDLESIGLSPQEFTYLLVNFTSAGVFYRINHPNDISPFPKGSYRHTMLEAPETRKAWPLLKKVINPEIGTYGKKIEATIKKIEEVKAKQLNAT